MGFRSSTSESNYSENTTSITYTTYDDVGQLINIDLPNNITIPNVYDYLGNLIKQTTTSGETSRVVRTVYDEYDAWGKCTIVSDSTSDKVGSINPMRYRGYYLDGETGFYYLQSRYYNAETCRF